MNDQMTRRNALKLLGTASVSAPLLDAQNPTLTMSAAHCRDISLTEDQAKKLLNRKLDAFMDDPNVRKYLNEKFNIGKFKIFAAQAAANIQVANTISEFKKQNAWDSKGDHVLPRVITWNALVIRYQNRLTRYVHEKLSPGFETAMKKGSGTLTGADKKYYHDLSEAFGYPNAEEFFGYSKDSDWQKTPYDKRPKIHFDRTIKTMKSGVNPFDLSIEDLRSIKASSDCSLSASIHAESDWQSSMASSKSNGSQEL
jgi:hypothetical protein